jgi:DNA-binding transcriptional LysR family regulator
MDTLTSIKVFRQVVDSGSFASAAERLDLSAGMVSKHVMHVESRVGVRLLNRSSRSLSLTEAGRLYLERCKGILDRLEATELELGCQATMAQGTLRLTAPSSAAGQWLAELLVRYRRRYPQVLVDLSFEDRLVDIVEEGYDVALRVASSREFLPANVVARPLGRMTFYLAASVEYVARRGMPKSLADLARHDLMAVGDLLNSLPPRALDSPLQVVFRHHSMVGVASAIAAGIGIAPVPASLFEDPLFRGRLVRVLPDWPLQEAKLYVVYSSRKLLPQKVRGFVDFIVESVSQPGQGFIGPALCCPPPKALKIAI